MARWVGDEISGWLAMRSVHVGKREYLIEDVGKGYGGRGGGELGMREGWRCKGGT